MSDIQITIVARCQKCSSDDLSATGSEPPDAIVTCNACCAEIGTVADVKAELNRKLHEEVAKQQAAIGRQFRDAVSKVWR